MESMARRKKSRRKVFDRFQKKITPTVSQDGVLTTLFLDLKDLVAQGRRQGGGGGGGGGGAGGALAPTNICC